MRRLALLTAAAAALGAHAATLGNAAPQDVGASSQMLSRLSKVIGSQHDLASVKSLPEHKQELLCMGTASSGSVNKAALKVALGADEAADLDDVQAYLEERCHAKGPVANMKAVSQPELGISKDKLCNMVKKADSAFHSIILGDIAETLGFDNPFSKKFGRLISSKCGVAIHPHPNPSKPVDPKSLKPDPCQAAMSTSADGSFRLPKKCGASAPRPGSKRPGPGKGSDGSGSNGFGFDGEPHQFGSNGSNDYY